MQLLAQDDTRSTKMWSGRPGRQRTATAPLVYQFKTLVVTRCSRENARGDAQRRPRVDSRLVDGRWVLEGPAPAWFRGGRTSPTRYAPCAVRRFPRHPDALGRRRGRPGGAVASVQVHRGPGGAVRAGVRGRVGPGRLPARGFRRRGGLLGARRPPGRRRAATWGAIATYQLVERPSPAHGPRFVANALSLCQRQASRPKRAAPAPLLPLSPQLKRARPAPLLPLSPQLKRARSLASVDNFHDIDAAQALAELERA